MLAAAAAIVLLLGGALLARRLLSPGTPAPGAPVALARTYRTATGARDSLRLADGTRVLLGPGSTLTLAANFSVHRELTLVGEAYFDVVHDATRPFSVRAGSAMIRDVGTRFDVRSDDGAGVRVVVESGSVLLAPTQGADSAAGVVLHAGEAGTLAPGGRPLASRANDMPAILAWTRGQLVFRGAALAEVEASLRRWYGVELRTDSGLAGRHLTMTFSGEPKQRVLETIALALGARLQLHGDTAVLTAGPPRNR